MYRHHEPTIHVHELRKEFRVPVRGGGMRSAIVGTLRRRARTVVAVDSVTFDVDRGEFVAFLGPNGAGKTTTLKMLTGLLEPTSGSVRVSGHEPGRRDRDLLRSIAMVMGQRSQLIWDLPPVDSFEVHRAIYRIPRPVYQRRVDEHIDMLDLGEVVRKPVRNLSLGERMKCELALALLHEPTVLFLDEPTIGLDTRMQRRIRAFLTEYVRRTGATVLLTSHDMGDVEELCERVIAIDRGTVAFDGSLTELADTYGTHVTVTAGFHGAAPEPPVGAQLVDVADQRIVIRVRRHGVAAAVQHLLDAGDLRDLEVAEPPVEELVESVWAPRPHLLDGPSAGDISGDDDTMSMTRDQEDTWRAIHPTAEAEAAR